PPLHPAGPTRSVRGPQGGHALIRDPSEIKLSEAIIALEGSLAPIACLDDPEGCPRTAHCCLLDVWQEVQSSTLRILDGVSIADLALKARTNGAARYSI